MNRTIVAVVAAVLVGGLAGCSTVAGAGSSNPAQSLKEAMQEATDGLYGDNAAKAMPFLDPEYSDEDRRTEETSC